MPKNITPSEPDEYERRLMDADRALARERVRMPGGAHAAFAMLAVYCAYQAVTAHTFAPLAIVAAVWLFFMTLRTVVTASHLHVQLGLFGPRIAIENIVDARAIDGSSFFTTGWGIRFSFDGSVTYSVPAFGRRYLRVEYQRGKRRRVVRVMSYDPDLLVRAIRAAQDARSTPHRTGVDAAPVQLSPGVARAHDDAPTDEASATVDSRARAR